ncbi:MAG: T9SS type A sorting domain-containing protein [Saprospiraceae bacterium]
MNQKLYILLLLSVGIFSFKSQAQTVVTIKDSDLVGNTTYDWNKNTVYLLDGYVFLEAGSTLNIQEGTIIKGKGTPTTGDAASALIITVGAQIFALGTADEPIIFTSEQDNIEDPNDLEAIDRGLWGGLILLGDATIARPGGTDNIEGIPADQDKARFGGTNDTDNSGTLRYVSIRHGGAVISNGDEINGLTLGGVGSGTTIEYIEVFANDDDGIEWFGGTVSIKYAAVAFCKDDSYDYDFGWRGKGQFWFTILDTDVSGRGGEHDGASPDNEDPFSKPVIANATVIGPGVDATPEGDGGDIGLFFRDRAGGEYWNSIITQFPGVGLAVEDITGDGDAYNNLVNGDLAFANNIWWDFGVGNDINNFATLSDDKTPLADNKTLISVLVAGGNEIFTPDFGGVSRITDGGLDPRPNGTSGALFGAATLPNDGFFDQVSYRGAFSNQNNWLKGWTAIDEYGYIGDLATPFVTDCSNPIVIKDNDLMGGQTYNWTKDNCYLLDGYVFLEAGSTLNIQEGTIIKGKGTPTTGDAASALIITVGAQIFALGTADEPIIFTSEQDNIEDPNDLEAIDRGLWGGLILLGDATIARPGGTDNIEGIPADQDKARFGGTNDTDNSGTLRYVSIRHGGAVISNGDEINGLTLGGVGSGTTIEYIEVFANDDDGIEWFGGTVSIKYAAVAFCKDDSYDYDFGWRGKGQFWFTILDTDVSGRGGEHDGASPDNEDPFSKPVIANATVIGPGVDATPEGDGGDIGLFFRDRAGGEYWNSIITQFPGVGLAVEDITGDGDAYNNLVNGDLAFANNIWWDFGVGNDINNFATLSDDKTPLADNKTLISVLVAGGNTAEDPLLAGVSRTTNMGLDPRPQENGPAGQNIATINDNYFTVTNFKGAFDPSKDLWLRNWTALSEYGYLGDFYTSTETVKEEKGFLLSAPIPTPSFDLATIKFELPQTTNVSMSLYDLTGRLVSKILDNQLTISGEHSTQIDVTQLANGYYFVLLQADGVQLSHKLIVTK